MLLLAVLGSIVVIRYRAGVSADPLPTEPIIIPSQNGAAEAIKITIVEAGIYQLTTAELAALGWDDPDLTKVRLHTRGIQQPVWVDDEHGNIYFYGQAFESRHTRENVYVLSQGGAPPLNIEQNTADGNTSANVYFKTIRVEENPLYDPRVVEGSVWFWLSLPAPQSHEFEFEVSALAAGTGAFQMMLFGRTEAANTDPDHHIQIQINGTALADETWDGIGPHLLEAEIPANTLQEGVNTLLVKAPGDTGVAVDIVLVDWFQIAHPRNLLAEQDRLHIENVEGEMEISGFSGRINVFDITEPEAVARLAIEQAQVSNDGQTASFYAARERKYIVVGPAGYLRPVQIAPLQTTPPLQLAATEANYLAIGPADLLTPLQPLLDWRENQAHHTLAIPIEAIYDQFNHGITDPEAIRTFLQFAVENWALPPEHILFVGDFTHDPHGYITPPEANRVPSFFIATTYGGETVSDIRYALLDDDFTPDLAMGRVPARTPEQVQLFVEKTLAYEQNVSTGGWQRRVFALADGQDPSFGNDASTFLEYFTDDFETILLTPEAGATGVNDQVAQYLKDGVMIMSYFGHGSITQLGKDTLFTTADGAALENGQYLPVMINITCLAGLFTHPETESLAETMLWNPDGGAIAVLAATSLTIPQDQAHLSKALVEAMLAHPDATLGQIVLLAQQELPTQDPGVREVLDTFLLFGDPALRLAVP